MGWATAAIQGGAALVGGKQQGDAAQNAANAQQQGARDAMQFDLAMYNQGRQDNLNALVTGNSAINQLARLYGLDMYTGQVNTNPITMSGGETTSEQKDRSWFDRITDPLNVAEQFGGTSYDPAGLFSSGVDTTTTPITFSNGQSGAGGGGTGGSIVKAEGIPDYSIFYQSPDYKVAYGEAMQAADRQAAATGGYRGGGHLADVSRLGANIGSQYFGNYVGNLMNIAGFGSGAAGTNASLGNSTAGRVGQNLNNAANARADGFINAGNARANSLANLGGAFSDWYGQRQGYGKAGGNAVNYSGGFQGLGGWGY